MLHNNRLNRCIQYHLRGLSRASLIYLLVFLAVDIILPAILYILVRQRVINGTIDMTFSRGQFGSTTFWLSSMIFLFVGCCASFREDFNHLLAMNNTRRNQFLAIIAMILGAGAVYTVLGLVFRILETGLEALVNGRDLGLDLLDYFRNYAAGRLTLTSSEALLHLAGYLAVAAFGTLAGILFYRYGKYVMVPFWICFGCSFVIIPIFATNDSWFSRFIIWFFGLNQSLPEVTAGLHLLALTALLLLLSGLFIRKVPQNA